MKELHRGPHVDCDRRGSLRAMSGDGLGEFGEQGRVPDRVKSMRCVLGYGSDFMSGIEDLHPLFGEQKQHIQGRVTWSESKLMIEIKPLEKRKDLMSEAMMDSITLLMIGRRLICL